jgi:hypothetical protein
MNNNHYFVKLNGTDLLLNHDSCTSEKHEILQFKVMSDYIIHEYNHPRSQMKVKIGTKGLANEENKKVRSLGVTNWIDENDESYGLLTVDKSENVFPLPLIIDDEVKYVEIKLTAPTLVYYIDILSTCKFEIRQKSTIYPHNWF